MNTSESVKMDLEIMIWGLERINKTRTISNYCDIEGIGDVIIDLKELVKKIVDYGLNNNFGKCLNEIHDKNHSKLAPDISIFKEREVLVVEIIKVVSYLYNLKSDKVFWEEYLKQKN